MCVCGRGKQCFPLKESPTPAFDSLALLTCTQRDKARKVWNALIYSARQTCYVRGLCRSAIVVYVAEHGCTMTREHWEFTGVQSDILQEPLI